MADSSSSNTAIVAIVILVLAALVLAYFLLGGRGGGDGADIEIDLPEVEQQGASSLVPAAFQIQESTFLA